MWSKKWYLKRNIPCDAHLLHSLLETDVPWDDAIVVSAGKLRKLWDSLSELRSSLCERRLTVKDSSEACAIACQNCAVYSVFPSGMTSHSKIAQFDWECIGRFKLTLLSFRYPVYILLSKHNQLPATTSFRKLPSTDLKAYYRKIYVYTYSSVCFVQITVELHSSGLIGMPSNWDMQKIRIIGFFFENRSHWLFEDQLLLFTVCTSVWTFRPHLIWSFRSHNTVLYLIR
jgi:hypothetical protein